MTYDMTSYESCPTGMSRTSCMCNCCAQYGMSMSKIYFYFIDASLIAKAFLVTHSVYPDGVQVQVQVSPLTPTCRVYFSILRCRAKALCHGKLSFLFTRLLTITPLLGFGMQTISKGQRRVHRYFAGTRAVAGTATGTNHIIPIPKTALALH